MFINGVKCVLLERLICNVNTPRGFIGGREQ